MTIECPKCQTDNPDSQKFCGECATPLPGIQDAVHTETLETPTEKLTTGSTFAQRYQIIEELGKGGMGRVYKVLDKETNEKIAIKLIKPEIASDKKTIERFRNELTIARKIGHRNVCRMYDLNREKDNYYITMEYVSGGDLKAFIRRAAPLSTARTIFIAKQICEGLAEAHNLGIVHRDLKPNNIMIDDNGNARIMDFGIARSIKGKGITGSGIMIGTPEYMSPEQVEAKEVDQRSDIYSLGLILYEMVTGQLPFEGDTPLAVAMKQKGETPRDPGELNPQIPAELSRLILRCLEKDQKNRFQSAKELSDEIAQLEGALSAAEITIKEKTSKKKKVPRFSKKNLLFSTAGLVALAAVVLVIGTIMNSGKGKSLNSIAVLPFANVSADPDLDYLCDGLTESLIKRLSMLPDFKVISRYSVLKYKGTTPNLEILGKELDVRVVLTGSIASRENRLVINAELVKVEDSSRIWGDLYNLQMGEIFSVQDEIASVISDNLRLRLTREEKQILTKHSTDNVEAYKLYLQGRFHWNRRTSRDLEQAITYFEKAVAVDPDFALGYAGLAETYSVIGTLGLEKPNLVFPKVEEFSLKALSLDENTAEAYAALATFKHAFLWDFAGAVEDFKKAIQINPNYATAYQWLAELYATQEKADLALEQIKKARELDPHSIIIKAVESQVYLLQKKYDKAIETISPVLDTNPDFYLSSLDLLHAYLGKKEYEKALKTTEGVLDPGFEEWAKLRVYAASGDKEQAREMFESFVKIAETVYFSPAVHAIAYGDVGEVDEAFRLLDQAYEEKDLTIFSVLSIFPLSPEVRGDPRYMALRKRMGLD